MLEVTPSIFSYGKQCFRECIKNNRLFFYFSHPLKREEIKEFLPVKIEESEFDQALTALEKEGTLKNMGNFWGLSSDINSSIIEERMRYEGMFDQFKNKAIKNAKLIAKFPFVRGVFISGSMSKGIIKDDGDVDFFIITKQGSLWMCRTFLIFYKKVFKLNSRKYFCLNYFVGDESMEIPDKNIFTATELASMIPVYNSQVCSNFLETNNWYRHYLPNHSTKINIGTQEQNFSLFKASTERLLNNALGTMLDRYLMRLTLKTWKKKFPDFTEEMMELAMRSTRNVSKHHPNNFQQKVLKRLEDKLKPFTKELVNA